jgi:hypothetical protein
VCQLILFCLETKFIKHTEYGFHLCALVEFDLAHICFLRKDRIYRKLFKQFDAVFSGGVDAVFGCGYREYVSRRCFAEIRRRYEGT